MTRSIEEIAAEIGRHKDAACGFEPCSTCTQLIPGAGDPAASVMLIGEAPGKNEDEQGVPFVGAAGKMLDQLLDSVSLARSDVFITNVLKARPPENRDPTPAEAAHHWPWLEQQLAAVDPDVVVLLGRHAMERFLPGRKISAAHGEPRLKDGRVFLPVYHPAAALYNGSLRATVFADFAGLPALVANVKRVGRPALRARSGLIEGFGGEGGEDLALDFADEGDLSTTAQWALTDSEPQESSESTSARARRQPRSSSKS